MNKQSLEIILKKYKLPVVSVNKPKKVFNKDFTIPKYHEYNNLMTLDYKVPQLKQICAKYGILKKGNKSELIEKIYRYLYFSNKLIKIQKNLRKHFVLRYITSHGPAFKNRKLCVNETDFLSLEPIEDIPFTQFFSYNEDNIIYGYNISSLYEYIFKKDNKLNPYNRKIIEPKMRRKLRNVIKLSNLLKIPIETKIKVEIISPLKMFELNVISTFNKIDELGNYTYYKWFYDLEKQQLIRYIRELHDIWNYRLQLTPNVKHNISPNGDPFGSINLYNILNYDRFFLKKSILNVINKFVDSGLDNEAKSLGAIYVLTALTLVSNDAAVSMPWLYHSVIPL